MKTSNETSDGSNSVQTFFFILLLFLFVFVINLFSPDDAASNKRDYDEVIRLKAERYEYEDNQKRINQQIEYDARIRQMNNR